MKFGKYIKNKRIAQRITLREFARQLEVDPSNWSKIERGFNTPPSSDITLIDNISKLLNLTPVEKQELLDLAALSRGQIPKDLQKEEVLAKMPAFFRAIRGREYTPEDLEQMVQDVTKIHQTDN